MLTLLTVVKKNVNSCELKGSLQFFFLKKQPCPRKNNLSEAEGVTDEVSITCQFNRLIWVILVWLALLFCWNWLFITTTHFHHWLPLQMTMFDTRECACQWGGRNPDKKKKKIDWPLNCTTLVTFEFRCSIVCSETGGKHLKSSQTLPTWWDGYRGESVS